MNKFLYFIKIVGIVYAAVTALLVFTYIISPSVQTAQDVAEMKNKKVEEKVEDRRAQLEQHFDPWDGSHTELRKMIEASMNDPDSYEHVETRYNDNGATLLVQTKFRGRNVFGGMILETVVADTDAVTGKVLEIVSHE